MNNRQEKNAGFTLVIIIVMLALVTVEMLALTGGSNTILFQADNAYLEAVEQNMIASGLAWAKNNIKNNVMENFNKTVELDIDHINLDRATLRVIIEKPDNKTTQVQINTSCTRSRQTLKHKKKYQVQF